MFGWLNPDEKRDVIKYVTLCGVILGSIIAAIMIVDVYNCTIVEYSHCNWK